MQEETPSGEIENYSNHELVFGDARDFQKGGGGGDKIKCMNIYDDIHFKYLI